MSVRAIPRATINAYLKLARLPVDGAIRLIPGDGEGPGASAKLLLDRADATVRAVLAGLLGDPALREDAQRRARAAAERERGVELRARAREVREQGEARWQEGQEQADTRRRQAGERAESRRRQAEGRAQDEIKRAAQAETRRGQTSRRAAERRQEAIEKREPRERLEALEARTDALRGREQELAARDEARRLAEAAGAVKAQRKSTD